MPDLLASTPDWSARTAAKSDCNEEIKVRKRAPLPVEESDTHEYAGLVGLCAGEERDETVVSDEVRASEEQAKRTHENFGLVGE